MFRSIQWRIAIPFIFLILISMGLSGFYLIDFIRGERIDDLRSQLEGEASLIAEASLPLLNDPLQTAQINDLAKTLSQRIDSRVTIIDIDGTVIGDSEQDAAVMDNHAGRPEVLEATESGVGDSTRHSTTLNQRMMYVAVLIEQNGSAVGIARVALPTTEVDESIGRLQRSIGISMGVAAIFATLIAFSIARATTRPIKELTNAAKRIASGELDQTIYPETRDESAELASAFNEMSQNLKAMFGDLSTERNKLAAVLDTMADGVVMTDVYGSVIIANPAAGELFRFQPESAVGHRLVELIPDHEVDEMFKIYLRTGEPQIKQIEQIGKGRLLQVIVSRVSYHEAVGALLLFQDLTEVKRLQSIRQKFIGNISHELRTPLASIKAVVETLKDGAIRDESVASDFMDRIDGEIDRMTQMVRELAELSRIETGQIELKLSPLDVSVIIDQAIDELQPQADRKGVKLLKELASHLPPVQVEGERILQVLTNLIHNAIKFTPTGGKVTISALDEGGMVLVSVADTGSGIVPDDLPHVFERFYKADKARSTEGTGLGLAIAKHIVQAHKGEIWVTSEVDQGSVFSFRLPVA